MISIDQLKLEYSTKETSEIVDIIIKLQSKLDKEIEEIHAIRKRTLENEEELRRVEKEIALIQDEKEYALTLAWPRSMKKGSQGDRWMIERVKSLEKETKDATAQFELLKQRAKQAIKEKMLPSDFDFPDDCRQQIERLEGDVVELSKPLKKLKIAEWAEEELAKYVQDQKEDANLLCQSLERLKREKFGLDEAMKLQLCMDELKGIQHTVRTDDKRAWKILPIANKAPETEEISDTE